MENDMNIRIGSAPDSWGVWFPDDPKQVPWQRFLDELARAGYEWTELGPFGYLPTDPAELRRELTVRGLHLSCGTVTGPLHDPARYQNTEIESFIRDTDPEAVSICLDTGHVAYRGGDPVQLVESYSDRIPYLHLKSVDPAVQAEVQEKDLPFATAVGMGVMSEPAVGIVDVPRLARVLREIDYHGWIIVEQDMYPCDPDKPFPIAQRTRAYLKSIGLG
jgi:inosose dehydratase